ETESAAARINGLKYFLTIVTPFLPGVFRPRRYNIDSDRDPLSRNGSALIRGKSWLFAVNYHNQFTASGIPEVASCRNRRVTFEAHLCSSLALIARISDNHCNTGVFNKNMSEIV